MYSLIILMALHVVQAVIISVGALDRHQWFFWDATNVLTTTILAWLLFKSISYKEIKFKFVSFLFFIMMIWSLTSFILLSFFFTSMPVTVLFATISIVPLFSLIKFWHYSPKSDRYIPTGSYLVFRKPKSLLGLFAIAIGLRGSSVSAVVGQKEYLFAGGKDGGLEIVEIDHVYDNSKYYKRVEKIDGAEIRKYKGYRWKPWKTCFHFFRKYDRPFRY